jgi:hypothetical protein
MLLKSTVYFRPSDRSIGNIAFGNFFGKLFNFPLKTESTPTGLLTEAELFEILAAIFSYLFFNADEVWGMKLKTITFAAYKQVADILKLNIDKVAAGGPLLDSIDKNKKEDNFMHLYGDNLIRRMLKDKKNTHDSIITQILLTASGLANLSAMVFPGSTNLMFSLRNCSIFISRMSTNKIGMRLSV